MPTTKKKEEQTQLPVQNVSNQSQNQQTGNGYQSKWQPQINDLMGQYLNRDQFKYDVNEDALYQQMKDMYVMQGQKAMMDTMGQTTALTGGYGNSWAQGAGQQAYQGYLQQLNDNIPDLYQMALNQYMNEGDQIAQNIGMMMDQEGIDYGRYRDQMADQEDAYNKLVALMENYHYEPTAEELAAAGMPVAHKNAIMQPYYDALAAARAASASSGGGGSSGGRGGNPNPEEDDNDVTDNSITYSDVAMTGAALIEKNANKSEVAQYVRDMVNSNNYVSSGSKESDIRKLTNILVNSTY